MNSISEPLILKLPPPFSLITDLLPSLNICSSSLSPIIIFLLSINDKSPFTVISPTVAFKTLTPTVVPVTVPADMVLVEPVVMFPVMFILPTPEIFLALRSK